MSKTIHLTHLGMEGAGPNVKAARADATRKIAQALSGSYVPWVCVFGSLCVVLYRDPNGWNHRLLNTETPFIGLASGGTSYAEGTTFEEAREAACAHMAQCIGRLPDELRPMLSQERQVKLEQYFGWQARYAAARRRMANDEDARAFASTTEPEALPQAMAPAQLAERTT